MEPVTAYLGLGANQGDREEQLRLALKALNEAEGCAIVNVSSLYSTIPVGLKDQPDFLNAVVEVTTVLSPAQLLDLCLGTEESMGRKRTVRWGPRVIDIDILLYDALKLAVDSLTIPHPRLQERAFALAPLAEIAPNADIGNGMCASAALAGVADQGVEPVKGPNWWH